MRCVRILAMPAFLLILAASPVYADTEPAAFAPWPHIIAANGAHVVVYQPQAIAWPDQRTLTARAAIEVTPPGAPQPILGTIEVSLTTAVEGDWVLLSDPKLLASHFPSLDTEQAATLEAKIRAALLTMHPPRVALASLRLSLGEKPPEQAVATNNDPPIIFTSDRPASLVVFDGPPILAPVDKSVGAGGLSFAVNTNWDVFVDHGTWYLLDNGLWLAAPAATGPYQPVTTLPPAFAAIPNDASFAAVRASMPPRPPASPAAVPHIYVATRPAEIIVTAGPPQFMPVPGTGLQFVRNTASTLFFDPQLGRFYFLVSGRWFAAPALAGPWVFATNDLPLAFSLIPPGSPEGAVLAAVPGTVAAEEAVVRASIPETATLNRTRASLAVVYAGPPRFQPIPGTALLYAVNTDTDVLKVGSRYYACYQGAWFVSSSPTGPWALADSIPPDVATIPPASPLYPVTYVHIYAATPATVTYGYTAGYLMGFVTAGVLVYGTGYYYPPVVLPGPIPIYYPYPYTYAGHVWYNSTTGAWARGGTIYGPYGAASAGRAYNPATGAWAEGAAVFGPYGGAGAWSAYNPRTGTYAHGRAVWGGGSGTANANFYNPRTGVAGSTTQDVNPYERWGSSTIAAPNQTVHTESASNARGSAGAFSSSSGAAGAGYSGVNGNRGGVVQGPGGDVYAGRDGNVYQHSDSGWSKWSNGGWTQVQPPANGGGRVQGAGGNGAAPTPRASPANANWQQLQQDRVGRMAGVGALRSGAGAQRFRR
jgi:hypothetical protein